ncbi:hypothetical protein GCM10010252_01380 [Streptomyces aureoverticillatus]|nr:hypothetical protein GCM10010252_01380 [Streptomyces aureoverticillatus]
MAYDHIQPAAFVPTPGGDPFLMPHYALAFPRAWRDPLKDHWQHGKPERRDRGKVSVPIKRLNQVIAAVAPDLVSVAKRAPLDDGRPWLYANAPYPKAVMSTFIHAWLRDLQPGPEGHAKVKETASLLDIDGLEWDLLSVDMLEQTVGDGGTAVPADHLWRLLPEVLAARIARQEPAYEHFGERLSFRQVAMDAGAPGAELVSWPPLEHPTGRGAKAKVWIYSAYIRICLRTAPFDPTPRIHLSTGVRRWVRGPVWLPQRGSASVYLLADQSFVPDGPVSERFAVGGLRWVPQTGGYAWVQGGPEGMLNQISAVPRFPSPDLMAKEPETWLTGRDGVTAAVVHHTMMGRHGVQAGIAPQERRRLTEWATAALSPEFMRVSTSRRSGIRRQTPHNVLESTASVPKKATDEDKARIDRENAERQARNAARRRPLLARAVGPAGLTAVLLHQTDTMRDHLVAAAEENLGLAQHRTVGGPDLWQWDHPDLTVRLHVRQAGELVGPLGEGSTLRRGDEWDAAMDARRRAVRDAMRAWTADLGTHSQLAFVELEGKDGFRRRTSDPKSALRVGLADVGLVSQFLDLPDPDGTKPEAVSDPHRAKAAWSDGLRQLGSRFLPEHSLGAAIPEDLNQLAFWLVKRNVSRDNKYPQFTPIAVLIRPGQDCVLGRTAETSDWVPYPELLRSLTGKIRSTDLRTRKQQEDATALFVRQTLYKLRGEPTLVLTHAQNTRQRWPWLTNPGLAVDRLSLGAGPLQRLAAHGRRLRVVRIASHDREETPQWWAPDGDVGAGVAKGLWVPADAQPDNRLFQSTSDKASQHGHPRDISKFTEHRNAAGRSLRMPGKPAWNPEILDLCMAALQPGDDPEQWAMYVHQQRFPDDYANALQLPLALHLARLAAKYAEPMEDTEQADPGTASIGATPEHGDEDGSEGEA